jgi:hypothetical protein
MADGRPEGRQLPLAALLAAAIGDDLPQALGRVAMVHGGMAAQRGGSQPPTDAPMMWLAIVTLLLWKK